MKATIGKKAILLVMMTVMAVFALVQLNNHTASANKRTNRRFHKVYRVAKRQLGKRYVFGSVGPHSFDCSGFVKYVYRRGAHKNLARTAQMQYQTTKKIRAKHARHGDLVFFGTSKRNISHVGLYLGHGKMIDAQNRGVVRENVHAPWWHVVAYSRVR